MSSRRTFVQKSILFIAGWRLSHGLPDAKLVTVEKDGKINSEEEELLKIRELIQKKDPLKWIFCGDSITQGAKHTLGYRSYSEIFAERVRWELGRVRDFVINTAISGNTSQDILRDFNWRVGQFAPNIVSLMVGTNDASEKKAISLESFRQYNIELIKNIRQLGAIPILQTPNIILTEKAAGRERIGDYVAITREVAKDKQVILVDHYSYWNEKLDSAREEVLGKWLNDELHPSAAGHVQIAQMLFRKLGIFDSNSFTCK